MREKEIVYGEGMPSEPLALDLRVIDADTGAPGLLTRLRELYGYRELLITWTIRDIKVRYKQSFLGASWAVIQPLSMTVVFTVVMSFLTEIPSAGVPYPLFAYSGFLPWAFLAASIGFGVPSLTNNIGLVTKTYFPREILPLSAIGAALFDLAIASTVFAVMLVIYGIQISSSYAWLPLVLAIQIMLTIGVTLLGAAVIVKYRDIRFVVPLGLQIWLYASPVIYPVEVVPDHLRNIYMLNPMAGIISSYRLVLFSGQQPIWSDIGLSALISASVFLIGYLVFRRAELSFADII